MASSELATSLVVRVNTILSKGVTLWTVRLTYNKLKSIKLTQPVLKSGGYKISALDVEREIFGLDYIAEVTVVGVTDEEFGQRVAAIVRLHDDVSLR